MSETLQQAQAIKSRGKVLVSASAGAGKTTVMIKRLADIIEEGADLDEVLAVTFTKKAAVQMKDKLRKELIARFNSAENDGLREHLRTQLNKVNIADVSTVHSFCARLIRTYFYALKVDASFEVLVDGAESNALKTRAADAVFDELYSVGDEGFYLVLERLRRKRSDRAVRELMLEAYDKVRIHPDYAEALQTACESTYTEDGFDKVCDGLLELIAQKCSALAVAVKRFKDNFHPALNAEGYIKILDEMQFSLSSVKTCQSLFSLPQRLASSVKPRVRAEVAADDEAFSAFCDGVKKRYKLLIKDIGTKEEEYGKFIESGKLAKAFSNLVLRFDKAYTGVKREEGKLDYGDLEHLALSLLKGDCCVTDVRDGIRKKYKYVFVDEYQDVNPIQDEIITAVAGCDLFCVGDLKQAIYGFRGSNSRFFADKCSSGGSKYLVLPDNFRSSRAVIKFVNDVFSKVMSPPVCDINYPSGHAMRGGARYGEGFEGVAEICLYDGEEANKPQAEDVYSVEGAQIDNNQFTAEGLAVLHLVEEALNGDYFDPDEGVLKRVQTGDICVLTRKRANSSAKGIVRALTTKYPVASASEVNVCDRPEIIRVLNVLSYLDNGEQDIPFIASLLSPLGNVSERELAKIRLYGGTGKQAPPMRVCVKKYAKEKSDVLSDKLKLFFGEIQRLRALSKSLGAARLIDEIVKVNKFAATFDSEQKLFALRRLQREAYSASGELYLAAFLAKIKAADYKVLAQPALGADSIKVMTMHASKGLEFPVVIVADIAADFAGDDKTTMPYDATFGFAPRSYDPETRTGRSTILRNLIKARNGDEELDNEINLFYVACTRAKYKLYLLTSRADGYDAVRAPFAQNYADLFDVKSFAPRAISSANQPKSVGGVVRVLDESRADDNTFAQLKAISGFVYPYALGIELPVKSSASHLLNLKSDGQQSNLLFREEFTNAAGTGIDEGVAYHRFLQLCDFSLNKKEQIGKQIDEWVAAGMMDIEQQKLLSAEQIERILAMPAFENTEGKELFREREFVCRLPSADYTALLNGGSATSVGEDDGNGVIVQGAIDLLAIEKRDGKTVAAHIIDYKFSGGEEEYLRVHYAPQLALYKDVVCKIYNLPKDMVKTTIINIRKCVQIDLA